MFYVKQIPLKYCIMKRLILIAVLFAGSLFAPATADAQIDIRVNIGIQPVWGPVGFDYVEYYYIPELDIYYYVPGGQFIYMVNGRWVARTYLPARYRDFDFFRTRVIVLNEYRPFLRHGEIRRMYANYRDYRPYVTIRDVRDPRYYINRHHPEHSNWKKQERDRRDDYYKNHRDNDRDHDRYNDRDNDRNKEWRKEREKQLQKEREQREKQYRDNNNRENDRDKKGDDRKSKNRPEEGPRLKYKRTYN